MKSTHPLVLTALFSAASAASVLAAAAPTWPAQTAEAIKSYQKQLTASLEPLYAQWKTLTDKAVNTPGGAPGSLVPPAPVETQETYRSLQILSALPDKWRVALMAAAIGARDKGAATKKEGKPPEAPYSTFQAEFAGKPRGLPIPRVPEEQQEPKAEFSPAKALAALEEAGAASGNADAKPALAKYQMEADHFGQLLKAKVLNAVRTQILTLKGALAKTLPEDPPDWKALPDELSQPIQYFLASNYYEGHGGLVGTTSSTGTGDGTVSSVPTGGGTGDGKATEPGPGGTGAGDAASEPSDSGTGAGKATPKEFEGKPGTGSGKTSGKAPAGGGTGTGTGSGSSK